MRSEDAIAIFVVLTFSFALVAWAMLVMGRF
jgi:hypothetical protein